MMYARPSMAHYKLESHQFHALTGCCALVVIYAMYVDGGRPARSNLSFQYVLIIYICTRVLPLCALLHETFYQSR
ncbi:hypothetical protein BC629DRAFT_533182 [Irpex lacteus]|nr:hypothetical protein BC629DRAFT_533182 [Irpex lacteus]